jgi:hypothetical protein
VDIRGGMAASPATLQSHGYIILKFWSTTMVISRAITESPPFDVSIPGKVSLQESAHAAGARAGPMRFNNGTYLNMYVQCGEWDTKLVGSKDDKLILYALIASTYTHTGRLGLTIRR